MNDRCNLARFVTAQDPLIDRVRAELSAGAKRSHWMWFVFPQLAGLGSSPMARRFAIASLDEAAAYLAHPVLGPRLVDCTGLVNAVERTPIDEIFGRPDDLKFRSSMTLFARVPGAAPVFAAALDKYFGGEPDPKTMALL